MFESVIVYFALPIITIAFFIVFIRILKGPSIEDRIVAFDLLTAVGISFISLYAVKTNTKILLDAAIILALISFLGTVAFAYYLERRTRK